MIDPPLCVLSPADQRTIYEALMNAKGAYQQLEMSTLYPFPGIARCRKTLERAIALVTPEMP